MKKSFILPETGRTYVMGVLNVTPDSFSDGGKFMDARAAVEHASLMAAEGADIIDVGGESSRPASSPITAEEELARVIPVIRLLKKKINIPISVDTWKSSVASSALAEGASYINDITALSGDIKMASVISFFDAGVILMHMKGRPFSMQKEAAYDDVVREIMVFLKSSIDIAEKAGVNPGKIIIDPGIGFGKTLEHNLEILRNLQKFRQLGKPILVGVSKKSFIGEITGKKVNDRMFGTAAGVASAIINGADMVRVHDVGPIRDIVLVADAIRRNTRV